MVLPLPFPSMSIIIIRQTSIYPNQNVCFLHNELRRRRCAVRRAESGTKKAEENGLNSGYYAHTQRTRDIASTEAELSFCVAG